MKKIDIKLGNKYLSPNNTTAYLEFVVEEDFDFLPGQFAMLDNGQIKRPYSFASSPALAKSEKKVCFYVKKVSENGMSKYLVEDISV
jgi:NAD(P)H-flavin reductase